MPSLMVLIFHALPRVCFVPQVDSFVTGYEQIYLGIDVSRYTLAGVALGIAGSALTIVDARPKLRGFANISGVCPKISEGTLKQQRYYYPCAARAIIRCQVDAIYRAEIKISWWNCNSALQCCGGAWHQHAILEGGGGWP